MPELSSKERPSKRNSSKNSFSFPASERIKKRDEFLAVQDRGQKFHSKLLLIFIKPTSASSRLGITVSKRVHKDSTKRNRVRRRIRELYRLHRPAFLRAVDIVVLAKSDAVGVSYRELEHCFLRLLASANVVPAARENDTA